MLLQLHLAWPGPRKPLGEGRGSASADMGQVPHAFSSPVRMGHTGRSFPLSEWKIGTVTPAQGCSWYPGQENPTHLWQLPAPTTT